MISMNLLESHAQSIIRPSPCTCSCTTSHSFHVSSMIFQTKLICVENVILIYIKEKGLRSTLFHASYPLALSQKPFEDYKFKKTRSVII